MDIDRPLLVSIAKGMNYTAALIMVVDLVLRFFYFGSTTDIFFYFFTFYLPLLALLLIVSEARVKRVILYIEFLNGRRGKGFFILLIGILVFDESRTCDLITGVLVFLIGLFNLIVGFIKKYDDRYQGRQYLDNDDSEMSDEFDEEDEIEREKYLAKLKA